MFAVGYNIQPGSVYRFWDARDASRASRLFRRPPARLLVRSMARDGSQPVEWEGQAFPYLMHHPKDPNATDSYAKAPAPAAAAHGVWDGPAPKGSTGNPTHAVDSTPAPSASQPDKVTLSSGQTMPLLGIGTYKLENADALKTALEIGYRHIDCAPVYGNQKLVGEGLADFIKAGRRSELFIITKIWNDEHRPDVARKSVKQSLEDLGIEYADLVLVHWPHAWKPGTQEDDPTVTIQETWQTLESLVDEGLIRDIGVSNFSLAQIDDIISYARIKPVVNQVELHPFLPRRKLVGGLLRRGLRAVAFSPLGHSKTELLENPVVVEVAEEIGVTPAQVLLRWNVQRGVGVIPKAGSEKHVRQNADIFSFSLSYAQKEKIDGLESGKRFVTNKFHTFEED